MLEGSKKCLLAVGFAHQEGGVRDGVSPIYCEKKFCEIMCETAAFFGFHDKRSRVKNLQVKTTISKGPQSRGLQKLKVRNEKGPLA